MAEKVARRYSSAEEKTPLKLHEILRFKNTYFNTPEAIQALCDKLLTLPDPDQSVKTLIGHKITPTLELLKKALVINPYVIEDIQKLGPISPELCESYGKGLKQLLLRGR